MANLKPTHQSLTPSHTDVTAWQFDPDAPIPVWVARLFHNIGEKGKWHSSCGVIAKTGDWAVRIENTMIILVDEDFKNNFRAL